MNVLPAVVGDLVRVTTRGVVTVGKVIDASEYGFSVRDREGRYHGFYAWQVPGRTIERLDPEEDR